MTKSLPKQSTNGPLAPGPQGRAVGLDVHPDSFAAAILEGRDPLHARIVHSVTRQPLEALAAWAVRHTTPEDVLILEASANSFAIAERLAGLGRQVYILESHRAGQPSGGGSREIDWPKASPKGAVAGGEGIKSGRVIWPMTKSMPPRSRAST